MTDLLRRVVARIELLPPEQQDAIAEAIERELEEQEWESLLAKPGSQRFLDALVAEAQREDAAGKTRESGDRW
ncbi:MAG: hypothetical protein M3Q10_05440 [Chloroflexota bacterium]|nr:hypothetical protein [Chloroflexota bacterium]